MPSSAGIEIRGSTRPRESVPPRARAALGRPGATLTEVSLLFLSEAIHGSRASLGPVETVAPLSRRGRSASTAAAPIAAMAKATWLMVASA